MKKHAIFIMLIIFSVFCISIPSYAMEKHADSFIYSTDILAYVNGQPIDGYNIGGRTVVIAEDLSGYGFGLQYDDELRRLSIQSYFYGCPEQYGEIPRGKTGEILGNIYETDITVFLNGLEIKGYNIGGRTAVCLEDMGDDSGRENGYGYSKYLGKTVWDPKEKTISFESYIQNAEKICGISRVCYGFYDNIIYINSDDYRAKSDFVATDGSDSIYNYSPDFGKNTVSPLFLNTGDELTEIGMSVENPNSHNTPLMFIYDTDKTKELIKENKSPQKNYNEALGFFDEKYEITEKIENENYTVLTVCDDERGVLFIYLNKNGGFVVDGFCSPYKDREIKIWFDESNKNILHHSVFPFGGPHGTTTMHYASDLDEYDYT